MYSVIIIIYDWILVSINTTINNEIQLHDLCNNDVDETKWDCLQTTKKTTSEKHSNKRLGNIKIQVIHLKKHIL